MAQQEDKRNFVQGRINRDLNSRILQSGEMRDALNVNTSRSEGSDIGSLENLRGNERISGQGGIQGTTIGQFADPATNKIYMFVAHPTQGDGVYEYDPATGDISTIISDDSDAGSSGEGTIGFTFAGTIPSTGLTAGADMSSFITQTGNAILSTATLNTAISENTGSTSRTVSVIIDVSYNVPAGFDNTGPGTIQITNSASQTGTILPVGTTTFTFTGTIPSAGLSDRSNVAAFITQTGNATLTSAILDGAVAANTALTTRTVSVRVEISYNISNSFSNPGAGNLILNATPTQSAGTATETFAFADAGVTCSVNTSGTVIQDSLIGTSSLGVGQVASYGTVSSATQRTVSVRVVGTVPSGFINSGQPFDFTGNCPTTQQPFVVPTFTFANTNPGCSVDSQTGNVTVTAGPGYNPSLGSGQTSSYGTVSVDTARNISVRVTGTIPGGFQNAGDPFDFTGNCPTTQRAITIGAFTESDWTGSVSVSPTGTVLANNGNVGAVVTSPVSFSANTTDNAINRTLSVTLQNIPAGFSNTGSNITFNRTVAQPSNLPIFTEADWTGVVSVSQSGGVTSTVGNAGPITILTTSVAANNTANAITVNIRVQVTIPSGFRFFGSTTTVSRGAQQEGIGVQEFSTTVSIVDNVTNASVNPTSVILTAEAGSQDSSSFSVIPDTGFTFTNRNQVSVSSSNTTLASGLQNLDQFGNIVVVVSGTVGSSNQTAALTASGGAVSTTLSVLISGSTSATIGAAAQTCTANVTGASGAVTYAWTISSGLVISGSATGSSIQVIAQTAGSQTVSVTVSSGGSMASDTKSIFVINGGGPI